jgi:hypothetical protein
MKKDIEVNTVSPTSKCAEKIITMATQNSLVSERMVRQSCVMDVTNSRVYMTELSHTSQGDDDSGFESRWRQEIFLFSKSSNPDVRTTQLLVQ